VIADYIIYVGLGVETIVLVVGWAWASFVIRRASRRFKQASAETEQISREVTEVHEELLTVTATLEAARMYEKNCPKNRRCTDRKDN